MTQDKSAKHLPPYISYRTFRNFIDRLQEGIPARVDRSYWSDRLAGSTGTHLMATLRFLGLIDINSVPTNRLRRLVSTQGDQRGEFLKEIAYESFDFLLRGGFDPQTATYAQLQEVFQNTFQSTNDVNRKCIKFFVALANDAGISLSPFIVKRFRTVQTSSGTKPSARRAVPRLNRNLTVPQPMEGPTPRTGWEEMLLTKFPTFDPTWSDEVKLSWFKAFDELLRQGLARNEK